jgi:hypothetical protein
MSFYVKKLYSNELGWRSGKPNKAGKFLFVSKKENVVDFFPQHQPDEVDPSMSLGIIAHDKKRLVNAEYIYHNNEKSRHQGKDRRIYLNEEIDPDGSYFQPGHYVVFFKYFDEIDKEIKFILYRFTPDHPEYEKLEKITEQKNHKIFNNLDFIKTFDRSYEESIISKKTQTRITSRLARNIHDLYSNQQEFRFAIRTIYDDKCCILGDSIDTGETINCEAAHIKPFSTGGNHAAKNGLLLSRDLHWAFDKGCFTIDQSYEIKVHKKMKSSSLGKYDGKKIKLPNKDFWPSIKNITYHNQEIFLKFKEA